MRSFVPQIISKAGINCIGPETPYGDNPFWNFIAHEEPNQVAGAANLLCIMTNGGATPRTITIPAPQRHDGLALVDRVFTIPADGLIYGVLLDPAYAGNTIEGNADIIVNGGFDADLSGWDIPGVGWTWYKPADDGYARYTFDSIGVPLIQEFEARSMSGYRLEFDVIELDEGCTITISFWDPETAIYQAYETVTTAGHHLFMLPSMERSSISFGSNNKNFIMDNVVLVSPETPASELIPHMIRFSCDGPDVAAVFLDVSGNAYNPPFQPVPGA